MPKYYKITSRTMFFTLGILIFTVICDKLYMYLEFLTLFYHITLVMLSLLSADFSRVFLFKALVFNNIPIDRQKVFFIQLII